MKGMFLSTCFAGLLGLVGMMAIETPTAEAGYAHGRQYYGGWNYSRVHHYHYRTFNYRVSYAAPAYSHHYVIRYSYQPRYLYYYNPVKRVYWGRYDTVCKGYSLLVERDRCGTLSQIPECAFPKPGPMPAIPESTDQVSIDAPPTDLPTAEPPAETTTQVTPAAPVTPVPTPRYCPPAGCH